MLNAESYNNHEACFLLKVLNKKQYYFGKWKSARISHINFLQYQTNSFPDYYSECSWSIENIIVNMKQMRKIVAKTIENSGRLSLVKSSMKILQVYLGVCFFACFYFYLTENSGIGTEKMSILICWKILMQHFTLWTLSLKWTTK